MDGVLAQARRWNRGAWGWLAIFFFFFWKGRGFWTRRWLMHVRASTGCGRSQKTSSSWWEGSSHRLAC